jgi:hypothetical protein
MRRLLLFFFGLSVLFAGVLSAQQGGGQVWVNAFEDRDGDGTRDPNEPFITRGITVDLLDAGGVIVASALLDDSPNASRGLVGFQRLDPGTYTVVVTGADWTPTTETSFTPTIEANVMPTVLWYGAQRISAAPVDESPSAAPLVDAEVLRIAVSLLGAIIVMGVVSVIGFLIYLLAFARRAPKAVKASTGSMRAVPVDETGEIRSTRG